MSEIEPPQGKSENYVPDSIPVNGPGCADIFVASGIAGLFGNNLPELVYVVDNHYGLILQQYRALITEVLAISPFILAPLINILIRRINHHIEISTLGDQE